MVIDQGGIISGTVDTIKENRIRENGSVITVRFPIKFKTKVLSITTGTYDTPYGLQEYIVTVRSTMTLSQFVSYVGLTLDKSDVVEASYVAVGF